MLNPKDLIPGRARNAARQLRHRVSRAVGKPYLRDLSPTPQFAPGTVTSARINRLLHRSGGTTYWEIGVANGETIEAVDAAQRVGIDPWPVFGLDRMPQDMDFHSMVSDRFFGGLRPKATVDAVLLDGLHEFEQTYRDLRNSLLHLSPIGFILIDDTVPADAVAAMPCQQDAVKTALQMNLEFPRPWMGDVYKVVYVIARAHPELSHFTFESEGRHQTVVWIRDRSTKAVSSPTAFADASQLGFEDVWLRSLPEWFNAAPDESILRAFEDHLRLQSSFSGPPL